MVPNTSDDLPDPDTPVKTVSRRLGIATLTSFRLFSRAPWTRIRSWLSAGCWPEEEATSARGRRHLDGGDDRAARVDREFDPVAGVQAGQQRGRRHGVAHLHRCHEAGDGFVVDDEPSLALERANH